jgi:hypothetical protein
LINAQDMTIIKVILGLKPRFILLYAPATRQHLRTIDSRHYSLIRSAIEEQLLDEPERKTRNRKPLQQPVIFDAEWELRLGPKNRFQVFYRVDRQRKVVRILAIGVKLRERRWIAGEEITG